MVVDFYREFLAVSPNGCPSWLLLTGGSRWAVFKTSIYGTTWKSWDALLELNHQTLARF
jgi:hypothetical protein